MFGKKTFVSITVVLAAVFVRNYKNLNRLKAPIVQISSGKLQGVVQYSRDGHPYYAYLQVPFASPPLKSLRFEPPEPVLKWEGVRDSGYEPGPKCIQVDLFSNNIEGLEDCLYLSIYTPNISNNLPVIVWLHGGLFIFGSGSVYKADYFMDGQDVIIVTVNYRLGSMGFLNTGTEVRGNMGLKDQWMALTWVQENIESFGGNKNSVTLLGESAGAACANFHQLSPMSKGLFHKIISQSGMATMPWAIHKNPQAQAKRFAEKLNCTTSEKLMVACLKSLPAEQIVGVHLETTNPLRELISVFVPTIEVNISDGKTFLAESPESLLKSGEFTKVPYITGLDSHEGLINSAVIFRNESLRNLIRFEWGKWIPRLLYLPDDTDPKVLNQIREFYQEPKISHTPQSFHEFENITHMFSDRFWNMNFNQSVKFLVKHSPTSTSPIYLYYYSYKSEFTLTSILLALKGELHPVLEIIISNIKTWVSSTFFGEETPYYGTCHGDEISMQFYIPLPLMPYIPQNHVNYKFSKEIVKLWTDFAKSSRTQLNLEFRGTKWVPQLPNETFKYLQLDIDASMISPPFEKRVKFWNSLEY